MLVEHEEKFGQESALQMSEILKPLLDDETASEKASRTLWNAQMYGETLRQQEAADLLGRVKAEHQPRLQRYAAEHLALVREQLAAFANAGINLSQHAQLKYARELTPAQRAGLLLCPPTLVAVPNGECHNAGQDNVGLYLVPWDVVASAKLQKDMSGAGEFIPSGIALMTALAVMQRAKRDIEAKQKTLFIRAFQQIEASPADPSPAAQII